MFRKKSPRVIETNPKHPLVDSIHEFYNDIVKPAYAFTSDGKHTREAVYELRMAAGEAHYYLSRIEQLGPTATTVVKVIALWEAAIILFSNLDAEYIRDLPHAPRGDIINDVWAFVNSHIKK